jgi:hypothetical protein
VDCGGKPVTGAGSEAAAGTVYRRILTGLVSSLPFRFLFTSLLSLSAVRASHLCFLSNVGSFQALEEGYSSNQTSVAELDRTLLPANHVSSF